MSRLLSRLRGRATGHPFLLTIFEAQDRISTGASSGSPRRGLIARPARQKSARENPRAIGKCNVRGWGTFGVKSVRSIDTRSSKDSSETLRRLSQATCQR